MSGEAGSAGGLGLHVAPRRVIYFVLLSVYFLDGVLLSGTHCSTAVPSSSGGKLGQRGREEAVVVEAGDRRSRGARGVVARGPLVCFLSNFFCPAILHLLCPLLGALYFLCQILFGERGGEVAATDGTAENSVPP